MSLSFPDAMDSACREPAQDEVHAHLEKILKSPPFRSAETNRALLTFLVTRMFDHPCHHLKESEIAVSVFHRPASSFDPQSDSVVRVQMTRLRAKLQEYYLHHGAQDEICLEIPKGSYQTVAIFRPIANGPERPTRLSLLDKAKGGIASRHGAIRIVAALALIAAGAGIEWAWHRSSSPSLPPHLAQFWKQVVPDQGTNLIVFSNPRLTGTLFEGTLRYYDEQTDGADPGSENLTYSGSGDIPAVSALTRVFDTLGKEMNVRSGATLGWAQAKESNLIFVGRPKQNPSLRMLPRMNEFNFRALTGIVDAHPPSGGNKTYHCDYHPYSHDWAVIAFLPGLTPDRTTLVLAGTITYGSQAAAEFVCNESKVASLLDRLNVKPGGKLPFFEALIEVRINQNVPVWSHLQFARLHPSSLTAWQPLSPDEQ